MSDVIPETALRTGEPQRVVRSVLDTANDIFHEALARGEEVAVHRLGKIVPRPRAAMMARNPRTGEGVPVPAGVKASYRPSDSVVSAVNSQ